MSMWDGCELEHVRPSMAPWRSGGGDLCHWYSSVYKMIPRYPEIDVTKKIYTCSTVEQKLKPREHPPRGRYS